MSLKKFQFSLFVFIFSGYFLYQTLVPQKMIRPSFRGINVSEYSSRGIVDRSILLKINTGEIKNLSDSDSVKVSAVASLPFDYSGQLEYKWIMGEKVILTKGSLTGSIQNLKKDTPQTIEIFVRGFNSQNNRHIGIEVYGSKNNRKIYSDFLISSQMDQSFENTVKNVERLKSQKSGIRK